MSSGRTGGQLIVDALERAGVRHCFGVPGESFLGILDAFYGSEIGVVAARHEGGGSFMASGYAKASGEIAVCFGTRAVGAANMAIGIHNARQDSTPMIAIAGQVNRAFLGREAFQEADLVAVMRPLTKWAAEVVSADVVPEMMGRALNLATSGRPGPVFLSVPQDVCDELSETLGFPELRLAPPQPSGEAVSLVLDALLGARNPLIFPGSGVLQSPGGPELLLEFAERTEIPVITSWRRHDLFPNNHRLFLGSASLGAPRAVWERLKGADVVLVLGNRLQEISTDSYEFPLQGTRIFQVDLDPAVFANHATAELAIQADAGATLRELLAALPVTVPGESARRQANTRDRERFEAESSLPMQESDGRGIAYVEIIRTLDQMLGPEVVVTSDAGNFYGWLASYYRFGPPGSYIGPSSGAMGYGLPSAIGAKLALPRRPVVSISGDGGFAMSFAEIETAVRYGINVVAVVLDNERHGTIRMHQEASHPGRVIATELGRTDLALVARGLGAEGYLVSQPGEFAEAMKSALAADAVSVIHVRMDRDQLSVRGRLEPSLAPAIAVREP